MSPGTSAFDSCVCTGFLSSFPMSAEKRTNNYNIVFEASTLVSALRTIIRYSQLHIVYS